MESVTILEQLKPSLEKIEMIERIERINDRDKLRELPENESLFKCPHCQYIFDIFEPQCAPILVILCNREDIICPNCGTNGVELMCKVDSYSIYLAIYDIISCRKNITMAGVDICPVCESPMCPQCYNHNCISLSRVTGYIQDVSGWNVAKRQELIDRKRYDIDRKGNSKPVDVRANRINRRRTEETKKREEQIEKFDRQRRDILLRDDQQYLNKFLA